MGDANPKKPVEEVGVGTIVVLVALFLCLNVGFNIFNKWLFKDESDGGAGFTVPIFATMTSALGMFIIALVLSKIPRVFVPVRVEKSSWPSVLAVAFFYAAGVCLNNSSLVFLPLHTQQIIRASAPIVVAGLAYVVEGKRYPLGHVMSMLLLVSGVVLTVATTIELNTVGLLLCLASVLNNGLHYTFISLNLATSKLKGLDLVLYTSLPAVGMMLVPFLATNEVALLRAFVELHGWNAVLLYVTIGCVLGIVYNLTIFAFIKTLSAVYLSITGAFKTVLVVVFSLIIFSVPVPASNAFGIGISSLAFVLNSYFEYQARSVPPPETPKDPEAQSLLETKDGDSNMATDDDQQPQTAQTTPQMSNKQRTSRVVN